MPRTNGHNNSTTDNGYFHELGIFNNYENRDHFHSSIGPLILAMSTFYYMYALEFFFIMKYHKNLLTIFQLNVQDFNKIYGINRKSNCTLSEYCTAVACMNICGGMVPATPSPYSPQFPAPNNTKPSANLAEQYHSLYRDFKHASQVELRDKMTSKERIDLNEAVEERFRQIIYPFTRSVYSVFTKLVDDFLKLFEEMVKGLILLKETGITMEDICSIDEHSQTYYSLQTTLTMRMDSKLSSCQPYNITELEKLLEHELKSQLENSLRNKSNCVGENTLQFHRNDSQSYEHEETTINNPYLTFLTEINCHMLHSCDTTEFDPILVSEKKMYLKNCLKLLRENEYFYVHSQSSSDSENCPQFSAQTNASPTQTSDKEMYNMSLRIYNQTVCHVQAAILAIFRSMKYGEQEKDRLFSQTTEKTDFERIDESKNLIKKTLSQYMNPNRDNSLDFQFTPSIKYEDERFSIRTHKSQLNYEPLKTRYSKNESEEKGFIREVTQQHPDLGYSVNGRYNTSKQQVQNVPTQKCALEKVKEKVGINGLLDETRVSPTCNLGNILFKGKKRDVRFMCTINYMNPEVSHVEAIKFLKHMEETGAALHRSYCSDNPFLTKVEGPSFYFTVACADCRQELAPPQKLEAFKSKAKKANRSKFMAYILRKSHDTIYFPVKCGSCGLFLCDPKEDKKHLLRVPFHSPEKGFSICVSRLKAHKCQADTFETDYRGCITDSMSTTGRTQVRQKSYDNSSRRGHSHEFLLSSKRNFLVKSRSVPAFTVDKNVGDITKIFGNTSEMARNTHVLKFEDAVTNILDIWTYEMINYEKGANYPHSRAQILNYRKSLSVFIKGDIKEKLRQRHTPSVSKPLLTHATLRGQAIKRSRSCHSKVRYETTASYRSRSESLIQDCSPQINTFQYALTELENDAKSFSYKNVEGGSFEFHFKSESLEHNNNTISISNNVQKRSERPYLQSDTTQHKNIARPHSLHSELKEKSVSIYPRRSSSFDTHIIHTNEFSKQINAWQKELQDLQKSFGSPNVILDNLHRKNMTRPLSLDSEQLKQITPNANSRRSISFGNDAAITNEFSNHIHAWKNELKELQKSVGSPHVKCEFPHHNNFPRRRQLPLRSEVVIKSMDSHRRRRSSASFATESSRDLSSEISQWKREMLKRPKSNLSPPKFENCQNIARPRPLSLHSDLTPETPAPHRRRRSCSFATGSCNKEDLLTQVNQWKNELIALQKSVQTPSDVVTPKITIRTTWLHNPIAKSVAKDDVARKNKILQFRENDDSEAVNRKTITKANSLQTEPQETTTGTYRRRYKSDSEYQADQFSSKIKAKDELVQVKKSSSGPHMCIVKPNRINHSNPRRIDSTALSRRRQPDAIREDFSAELTAWEQELLELQNSVESPLTKPETLIRRNKARSISLDSEPKADTTIHRQQNTKDDELDELKTWNHTLRDLEINASSPHLRSETRNYKIKTRAVSLHAEPKPIPTSSNRPKSESVLDFSMELNRWKHHLQTLEEDAKSPQSVTSTRLHMVKSSSLKSEPKYKMPAKARTDKFETHIEHIKDTWINTPVLATSHESAYMTQHKPPGRRCSATPRQLPTVPMPTTTNRRHSHYETTGNFVPLLHDKRATRLSTNPQKSTNSTVSFNQARKSSIEPVIEAPDDSF